MIYAFGKGRFGNKFIRNMVAYFIAKKTNQKCVYPNTEEFERLGIKLYQGENETIYPNTIDLTDDNFIEYVRNNNQTTIHLESNISLGKTYCQTREFSFLLRQHFNIPEVQQSVINKNKFNHNYQNNNDVFIHIRLGDARSVNQGYQYYDSILSKLQFTKGYIASDSPQDKICLDLKRKYNLNIVSYDAIETIMFGSTCKHVILSHGTFSYMIGLLSFFSTIYYPKIYKAWHGDIFVFPDWKEIPKNY